jgi:plastocyanin
MRTSTPIWIVAILIILGGLGWYYYSTMAPAPTTDTNTNVVVNTNTDTTSTTTPNTTGGTNTQPQNVTVTYGANGFSPASVTVPVGGSVTFTNQSGKGMWVASDEHPTHTEFDGTSRTAHCAAGYTGTPAFDQCKSGDSYTFTFTKAGTYEYHNHNSAADQGTVVVQ